MMMTCLDFLAIRAARSMGDYTLNRRAMMAGTSQIETAIYKAINLAQDVDLLVTEIAERYNGGEDLTYPLPLDVLQAMQDRKLI
jgi:hypothetical protein